MEKQNKKEENTRYKIRNLLGHMKKKKRNYLLNKKTQIREKFTFKIFVKHTKQQT